MMHRKTPVSQEIANDLAQAIESGELPPGALLPSERELVAQYGTSKATVGKAIGLLRAQGLIASQVGRGIFVRTSPRRVVRDSARHQAEKDLVRATEEERRGRGEAEENIGAPLEELHFDTKYEIVDAGPDLAKEFNVPIGEPLLRRTYETSEMHGTRLAYSVGYIPVRLIESNPVLLSEDCEPWPGGTQHQLFTVGIEIEKVVDEVTAFMPGMADAHRWALAEGVPLLLVRRISIDTHGRVVEVSDAQYPADRTELRFTTLLERWANGDK
jgi:GntR family transcriptional regulator